MFVVCCLSVDARCLALFVVIRWVLLLSLFACCVLFDCLLPFVVCVCYFLLRLIDLSFVVVVWYSVLARLFDVVVCCLLWFAIECCILVLRALLVCCLLTVLVVGIGRR